MSWDGTVMRSWFSATPIPNGLDVEFECGHRIILSGVRMTDIAQQRRWPCDECSLPNWEMIKAHRDTIRFDDVVGKLKRLAEES